ncbi:hypothetical protein, partial [Methanoregula sp.]|uniref:hypothetical protein n=1 Tax=Methanoregula sp. TaxID=2052170 RepID=UPI003566ADF0
FGGDLKARKFLIQMKEIASKMIVYNIHKCLLWFFIEDFYRAQILHDFFQNQQKNSRNGVFFMIQACVPGKNPKINLV